MYARVCSATGWTWDYVGEFLTLPRLRALLRRWETTPPVAESVAAFFFGQDRGTATASHAPAANEPVMNNADLVREMHTDPRTIKWVSTPNG